jgi:formate hydrogenlyase subunit 3/multisubunit Na+/H+ antiporter MnhD subunit
MSTAAQLFGACFILCAIGAIGALLASKRWSSIVLAAIGSLSAILILLTSALLLVGDTSFRAELWPALWLGTMESAADRLSALFLLIAGLVFLPVSIFSAVYTWENTESTTACSISACCIMPCSHRSC